MNVGRSGESEEFASEEAFKSLDFGKTMPLTASFVFSQELKGASVGRYWDVTFIVSLEAAWVGQRALGSTR